MVSKVKILVVEDEIIIADDICNTLQELGYETLEPAINYKEAIETIEQQLPDIAILDIQLSGKKTGIDIAKKIINDYNFPFIFLTSNTDTATIHEAKLVMPPAYLVKPFTKEELYSAIEITLYNYSRKQGYIDDNNLIIKDALFIKNKGSYHKLLFKDILYIKSAHIYIEIILKENKKYVIRCSLNDIIGKLDNNFMRVHRGYIVNLNILNQIDNSSLKIDEYVIPIGKKYKQHLMNKINLI